MSEQRLIDADAMNPYDICNKSCIDGVATLRGWVALQPTIDPETLPIVKELREKLARYEQAEAERRLAICPDKLYDLMFDECSPEEAYITEHKTDGLFIAFAGDYIAPEEIGESVFLTHEDAETALKRRASDDNLYL